MTTKWIVLAIAAACGLAAQTRMTAEIPFAFEFRGQKLAAGHYEITRTAVPNTITLRNGARGTAVVAVYRGTDAKPAAANGLVFQKAGESYLLLSVVDQWMGLTCNLPVSRKREEITRKQEPVPVFIAAR